MYNKSLLVHYKSLINNAPCTIFFKYCDTLNYDDNIIVAELFEKKYNASIQIVKNTIMGYTIEALYKNKIRSHIKTFASVFSGQLYMLIFEQNNIYETIAALLNEEPRIIIIAAIIPNALLLNEHLIFNSFDLAKCYQLGNAIKTKLISEKMPAHIIQLAQPLHAVSTSIYNQIATSMGRLDIALPMAQISEALGMLSAKTQYNKICKV